MPTYTVTTKFRDKKGRDLFTRETFKGEQPDAKCALVEAHKAMAAVCAADPRVDMLSSSVTGNGEAISTTDYADEIGTGVSGSGLMHEVAPEDLEPKRDIMREAVDTVLTDEQRDALASGAATRDGIFNPDSGQGGVPVGTGTFPVQQEPESAGLLPGSGQAVHRPDPSGRNAGTVSGAGGSQGVQPDDRDGGADPSFGANAGGAKGSGQSGRASQHGHGRPGNHQRRDAGAGRIGAGNASTGQGASMGAPRQGQSYAGSDIIRDLQEARNELDRIGQNEPDEFLLSPEAWDQLVDRLRKDGALPKGGTLDQGYIMGLPVRKNLNPGAPPIQVSTKRKHRSIGSFLRGGGSFISDVVFPKNQAPSEFILPRRVYGHECKHIFIDEVDYSGLEARAIAREIERMDVRLREKYEQQFLGRWADTDNNDKE